MSSIALQVEAEQAPLSQDVAWQRGTRSSRFLWTGLGFAVLMLLGLLGAHQRTLPAADADRQEMARLQTLMPDREEMAKIKSAADEVQATWDKIMHPWGYEAHGISHGELLHEKVAGGFAYARAWSKQVRDGRDDSDCGVYGYCVGGKCMGGKCIFPGDQTEDKRTADQANKDDQSIRAETTRIADQANKDGLAKVKLMADQAKKDLFTPPLVHTTRAFSDLAEKHFLAKADNLADKKAKKEDSQNIQAEATRIADPAKKDGLFLTTAKAKRIADQVEKDRLAKADHIADQNIQAETLRIADPAKKEGLAKAKVIADQAKVVRVFADARAWSNQMRDGRDDRDCRVYGYCLGGICTGGKCIGPSMQREAKRAADQAKKDGHNIQAETKRIADQAKKDSLAKATRMADQAKKDGLAKADHVGDTARKGGLHIQAETPRIADPPSAKKGGLANV